MGFINTCDNPINPKLVIILGLVRTINGSFYTVNLISEKTGCIYSFNSSYLSQGLHIAINLVMSVEDVM